MSDDFFDLVGTDQAELSKCQMNGRTPCGRIKVKGGSYRTRKCDGCDDQVLACDCEMIGTFGTSDEIMERGLYCIGRIQSRFLHNNCKYEGLLKRL